MDILVEGEAFRQHSSFHPWGARRNPQKASGSREQFIPDSIYVLFFPARGKRKINCKFQKDWSAHRWPCTTPKNLKLHPPAKSSSTFITNGPGATSSPRRNRTRKGSIKPSTISSYSTATPSRISPLSARPGSKLKSSS